MADLEELLRPVKTYPDWNAPMQFQKLTEEIQEVYNELEEYYCNGQDPEALHRLAVETGDVMIACSTMFKVIGADIKKTLGECYNKNKKRGYYDGQTD